jgi:hypothetical protein
MFLLASRRRTASHVYNQGRYLPVRSLALFSMLCSSGNRHTSHVRENLQFPETNYRTKTTRTNLKVDDLHSAITHPDLPSLPHNDSPAYPTVLQQAKSNMLKFENCVVLTRVGGFYELYFEHADKFGPLLNLKVAKKRTSAGPVSMVCILYSHDSFIKLIKLGRLSILPA